MKNFLCFFMLLCSAQFLFAQSGNFTISQRIQPAGITKPQVTFKVFALSDAKTADGKTFKGSDKIKTPSGKEITVDEYLARINELENQMTKRGYSLRNFKPVASDFKYKPVNIPATKIQMENTRINTGIKPVLAPQVKKSLLFQQDQQVNTLKTQSTSGLAIQQPVKPGIVNGAVKVVRTPEKIENVYSIADMLKPLTDMIQNTLSADGAKFNFTNAALTISTNAIPPTDGNIEQSMGTTLSEYKVALNFNASISGSFGLPVSITIPMATMNGEFVARSKSDARHTRRVIVNLMGKSLFNKTGVVTTATLSEEDQQELSLNEIVGSPAMNTLNFIDFLPSVGFNTTFSTSGSIGCRYSVSMDRNNVSALIGPTYSTNLRLAASYGLRDIMEGGIEGIITILRGGLEFGGSAGLAKRNGLWRAVNTTYVESTLEALKGEVNFFVRYPDPLNWSCFGPCIKKVTVPIFETPVAFTLRGRLLELDNGKNLKW